MEYNLAPEVLTVESVTDSIQHILDCAKGLGRELATVQNGWNQSMFFDHEVSYDLLDLAVKQAKYDAKVNNTFYNTKKLEDCISQMLVEAFGNGFIA